MAAEMSCMCAWMMPTELFDAPNFSLTNHKASGTPER